MASRPGGLPGAAPALRVSVVGHMPEPGRVRAYAENRMRRLRRHSRVHDATLVVQTANAARTGWIAELVVHLQHHVRLVATGEGASATDAVDAAVDRADRQVLRRMDRVTHHKGHVGADGTLEQ
jgi:ribosome-associated translation inhibitor RaiA